MATPVVEFSREGYKIRKIFGLAKNQQWSNEIIDLEHWRAVENRALSESKYKDI